MNNIKFAFLGDIALNGDYEELYRYGKKPFNEVGDALKDSIVVGNFECFPRGNMGVNELKKPRLETSLETLNYVKDFHLSVACLANNHVFDHLEDGFFKANNFFKKNDIETVGASLGNEDFNKPHIIEKNGIKIAILNYVTKDTNPNPPARTQIKLNYFKEDKVIESIKSSIKENVNHVVLCLHWGGRVEGGLFPDWDQPKLARRLIDAGADLIIGHHSHTVQPYEVYKGKYIFYSLGNLCFSEFEFENSKYNLPLRRRRALIPIISFTKFDYKVSNTYWLNKDLFIRKRDTIFVKLSSKIGYKIYFSNYYLWKIYIHIFKKITPIYLYIIRADISMLDKIKSIESEKISKLLKRKL